MKLSTYMKRALFFFVKATLFVLIISTVFLFARCTAKGEEQERSFSFNATSRALTQYIFPETGEVLHDQPVLQTEITLETKPGFYATIWHSAGFDSDLSGDGGDEIDYYLGWAGEVGALEFDAGLSYFDAVELFRGAADDTFHFYGQLQKSFDIGTGTLTPLAHAHHFVNGPHSEFTGGTVVWAGLQYEHKLPEYVTVPASFQIGYDDGAFGNDSGLLGRFELEASWEINETFTLLLPSVAVYTPLTIDDHRNTEAAFGFGISLNF